MNKKVYLLKGFLIFTIKKLLVYRVRLVSDIWGMVIIPIILSYFLWKSLITNNNLEMTLDYIMIYIIISNVILLFTQVHLENEFSKDIKGPSLGQKMLRPINYVASLSLKQILSSFLTFTFCYLPIIVVIICINGVSISFTKIMYSILFIIIGYILNSTFSILIGALSFWLTEIWGISAIRNLLTGLLAGAYFPLDILSESVKNIMLKLPFPYMSYFPTKILIEKHINVNEIYSGVIISIIWIVVLNIITSILVRFGFKKYSLNGA